MKKIIFGFLICLISCGCLDVLHIVQRYYKIDSNETKQIFEYLERSLQTDFGKETKFDPNSIKNVTILINRKNGCIVKSNVLFSNCSIGDKEYYAKIIDVDGENFYEVILTLKRD